MPEYEPLAVGESTPLVPKEVIPEGSAWAAAARTYGLNADISAPAHTDDGWSWVRTEEPSDG